MWTALAIISSLYSLYVSISNRPKHLEPDPSTFEDSNIPLAKLGRPIPVAFGTVTIKSPTLVWYGQEVKNPIIETVGEDTWLTSSEDITTGYTHYLSLHMVLCHGRIDALLKSVKEMEKQEELQAGVYSRNTHAGHFDFYMELLDGNTQQTLSSKAKNLIGVSDLPDFKGLCSVFMEKYSLGQSKYLPPIEFKVRRITYSSDAPQWYQQRARIGQDMNPAHIIRECLTSNQWGMGYSSSDIDDTNFRQVADTLNAEGFGLSLLWATQAEIIEFIQTVLKHINGSLIINKQSGKFEIALVRKVTNTSNVLALDESNIVKIDNFNIPNQNELVSELTLKFKNNTSDQDDSITVQNTALYLQQTNRISQSVDYPGIGNKQLAAKVASRDLLALSTPIASCKITCNRDAENLKIGDVFYLTWPNYGVNRLLMRVASIDYGSMSDNKIKIKALQDVFSFDSVSLTTPISSQWQDPRTDAAPAIRRLLLNAPYYVLNKASISVTDSQGIFLESASRSDLDSNGAELWVKNGSNYKHKNNLRFAASALLSAAIAPLDNTLTYKQGKDTSTLIIGEILQIGTDETTCEIVKITALSGDIITIERGCLDTVPKAHAVDSVIYAWQRAFSSDSVKYNLGTTIKTKLRTIKQYSELDIENAPEDTLTITNRHAQPYCPGNLKINNQYFPETITGDIQLNWNNRNRLTQTEIIDFKAGDITPEQGATVSVKLTNKDTNAVVKTQSNITGNAITLTGIGTGYNAQLEIWAVRNGTESLQRYTHSFRIN